MSETRSTETSHPSVAAFFFCCRFTHYICFFCINETLASTRRLWQTTEALFYPPAPPPPPACAAGKSWPLAGRATLRKNKQPPLQGWAPAVLRVPSTTFQAARLLRGWRLISYCKGRPGHHCVVRTEQAGVDVLLTARDSEHFYHNISFPLILQWCYTLYSDEWAAMPHPNSSQEIVFALHNKHELGRN